MQKGRVYWITGLPGSGKTTIGTALYYYLRSKKDNIIILDGDILKEFVGDTVGYGKEDRLARARKYSNICKMLADQGMWVIICTVAMFEEIREWNRNNIDGYLEIFLDVPFEVLKARNKKGLYSDEKNSEQQGLFKELELPKRPDIVIKNDGSNSIKECVEYIIDRAPQTISEYDRDTKYWNMIYGAEQLPNEPSNFAIWVADDINTNKGSMLELGCGNGRDSIYFLKRGFDVTAVDASDRAILNIQKYYEELGGVFVCDDFVKCGALFRVMYDYIYSRFTLHAINEKQEDELLKNIKISLKQNGRLYIEARAIHDDLYGKGIQVGKNEFIYNNHYRRFIDIEELKNKLQNKGFKIIYSAEARGFSKTLEQDPVLLRVVASI